MGSFPAGHPMKKIRILVLLSIVSISLPALAESAGVTTEVRSTVEAHRAAKREEVRREEAVMGRRLTPAELAELREQVRQQWIPRKQEIAKSAESQPAERMVPVPSPNEKILLEAATRRP